MLVLQPGSEEWLLLGEMKTPRSRAVIVNFGYQMMVIGGCDKGCPAEQFTPGLGTFGVSSIFTNLNQYLSSFQFLFLEFSKLGSAGWKFQRSGGTMAMELLRSDLSSSL